ncbi:condensation domain-containing protein [Variovorax sp. UC74_104]|uniref:condensation domain-containing protein n=1 Tax=Variovorax sp. UC74_104 TaxID=3374555 RepID=UPI003756A21F
MGHEFLVNGQVYAGEFTLRVMYSRARHDAASVQGWVDLFRQELLALVAHCTSGLADAQGVTPSDFPLAGLGAEALGALVSRLPGAAAQIENIYPLTPGQQGMLFESSLAPDTEVNVVQTLVTMVDFDPARLQSAWQSTVSRHDALRSGFHWLPEGEPVQVLLRQLDAPVRLLDWRGRHRDEAALEQAWEALCEQERRVGFDMARPPLARWVAVRVDDTIYRLAWTWHHILFDGWSVSRVMGELFALYAGQRVASALQPYADFVGAVRGGRNAGSEEQAYWRDRHADIDRVPTLLAGVPLQRWARGGSHSHRVVLDTGTTRALRALAQAEQVTLNTVLQAAWALLLMQRTGRPGVCFGVTMSGRSFEMRGIDDVVGLCVNSLPLMLRPDAAMGVGAWLRQIVSANLALRQREHAPLPVVQGWLGTPGQSLYDTLVIFENYPVDAAISGGTGPDIGIRASTSSGTLGVPLVLIVEPNGEEMWLLLEYARDVFDPQGVAGLAAQMEGIVKALLNGAGRTVASLLEATAPLGVQAALMKQASRTSPPRKALPPAPMLAALADAWRGVLAAPQEQEQEQERGQAAWTPCPNFFELGGDSLLAARLVAQWNARVDRGDLPARKMRLAEVFEHPVLDDLAAALWVPAGRADPHARHAPAATLEETL